MGKGVALWVGVGVEVGMGVDVGEGVVVDIGVGVDVGDGVGEGDGEVVGVSVVADRPQPGEGVALPIKSPARLVSRPAGWRSSEWPSGTSGQGGDITELSSP